MAAKTKTIRRSIASLNLSPNKVSTLVTYSQGIVKAMTGNPAFPSSAPALAAITAAANDLQTAETAALARTKGAVAVRNEKRAALVVLLQQLMAEREEKLALVQARLASMKTAPQVLDLESRRLEKEALKRIEDCRAVMGRRGDAAKKALSALLDGKLAFKPLPDKRYAMTGKVVTGALVHLLERPQRESNPRRLC